MRNLLTQLVSFTDINLLSPDIAEYSSQDLKDLSGEIQRFRQKIEKKITAILIRPEYQHQLVPHIRFIRQKLIFLSDHIFSHLPETIQLSPHSGEAEISSLNDLKFEKLRTIEDILAFIQTYCSPYIDGQIKVSNYKLLSKKQDLQKIAANILTIFKQKELPAELPGIVQDFVDGFSTKQHKEITCDDLDYAFKLLTCLEDIIKESPDPQIKIAQLFIDLDFNHAGVMKYAGNFIHSLVRSAHIQSELRNNINEMIMQVQMIEPNLRWRCDNEHNKLKDHILRVLNLELENLTRQQQTEAHNLGTQEQDLLFLQATYRQMELWAEINVKLKLIPFQSAAEVRSIMKRFVRSVQYQTPAYNYPNTKKPKTDDAAVKELHQSLSKQINYLEKKYSYLFTGLTMWAGLFI